MMVSSHHFLDENKIICKLQVLKYVWAASHLAAPGGAAARTAISGFTNVIIRDNLLKIVDVLSRPGSRQDWGFQAAA